MHPAFRCTGLSKSYPGFRLGPLDLALQPGTVLGYLGPNGSGKTTTMHCLAGLLRPDTGQTEVYGHIVDISESGWKTDVAYVSNRQSLYERWSGGRNLAFLSEFYPAWSADKAANLSRRLDLPLQTPVRDLSRGNRVKLGLVAALAANPRLLLLDEPTAGLDPVVRDDFLGVLFDLLETGECALFYSTHILSDIGRLADELAFLVDGQIVLRQTVADLLEDWRSITFQRTTDLPELKSVVEHEHTGRDHRVISSDGDTTIAHLSELGAEHIRPMMVSIDEIAVRILRGDSHVATD